MDSRSGPDRRFRAAAYVRVSTTDQTCALQIRELREYVERRGWELVEVYQDQLSGAKASRPGLDKLMVDAKRRRFDVVAVWRFDRFARSAKQLVLALEEFRALGIDFISHQEALDTSTPMGKAMFTIIGAMGELERNVIRERVVAGLRTAKAQGTKSGKPIGRPKRIFDRERLEELRREGLSYREIARRVGLGEGTVRQVLAGAEKGSGVRENPAAGLLRRGAEREGFVGAV
jgi:DNA invertase Pin-like site-specific DNA recombinase